jgi:2-keto-4-pentenoate hydratase/2-oxohepta-3-ene-1,7-dioic acid hydratase in catechol pathway
MKLVSFKRAGRTSWGIAADGGVIEVGGRLNGRFPTMRSALEADAVALIAQDAKGAEVDLPWSAITLLPPIPDPEKIIGFGLNYREHVIESGQPIPEHGTCRRLMHSITSLDIPASTMRRSATSSSLIR